MTRLKGAAEADWSERLPGWRYGALLPVPIVLRDLAAFPAVAAAREGSVRLIVDFIAARMAELGCQRAAGLLLDALREGTALLLLDGLDEVVGDAVLPRVAEAIVDAEKNFPGPILVTCRVLDYQEERLRQLPGFAAHTLAELDPQQIDAFIAAWYAELADSGRRPTSQATDDAREMQGAVQSRDELRALAGTPLLLTLMAQVHAFRGTLPDARALLYYSCVELLLLRWRQPRDEPDLIEQLGLARFRSSDLLALMARLGYETHARAERDQQVSGPADLDEATLVAILAEVFEAYDQLRKFELAGLVLRALAGGNGLLLQRGPKLYTFAHRTFQEFLAGYHLKGLRNAQQLCRERARQLHWHEALLLMAGYQVLGENELEKPVGLAEKLLAGSPLEQALGGDMLALVGRERARSFDPALVAPDGLWPTAVRALRALQRRGQAPGAPASLRHRAGLALGRLCYGELKDLVVPAARPPAPDPRLPLAVAASPRSEAWRQALQYYWCPIAPGPFWSGDDRKGADESDNLVLQAAAAVGKAVQQARGARKGQLSRAEIHHPYRIARYPVTNAYYARFLAANGPNGYEPDKPWWTEEGHRYLLPGGQRLSSDEPEQITHPRFWSVSRYNGALQPVVGVSWYEAAAYCRWLTSEGHAAGWLPMDDVIRLPTWHEWERAARHVETRRYPWGAEPPDPERANYRDSGLGAPSPIGCFAAGTAACGAQDMVGNVGEWTASPWRQWSGWQKDFTLYAQIVWSWNAFTDSTDELFCGARSRYYPFYGGNLRSFRVVQSRALTE
jgi:formylglycine-generating enzyme required for sulfatase activity